jgi:predicted Holliday junction resolvase-like endonuclease
MKNCFLVIFSMLLIPSAFADNKLDSLIKELDKKIELRGQFQQEKEERILSLKKSLYLPQNQSLKSKYSIDEKIYEEYKSFIYDSAFSYANKLVEAGKALKDKDLEASGKVKLSFTLLSTGMFKEALDILASINQPGNLPVGIYVDYLSVYARTYYDMADYAGDTYYVPIYNQKGNQYLDSALKLLTPKTPQYLSIEGMKEMRDKNIPAAISTFKELLGHKLPFHQKAIATSSLGYIYRLDNQIENSMELLAIAALNDIQSSIKETVAIRELAEQLYKKGDLRHAYRFVKIALEDAFFYNAKHRKIQISNILPIIEGKQLENVESQRKLFLYYSILITLLSILVLFFVVVILRQNKKLKQVRSSLAKSHESLQEINTKLQEVNRIKEEYIGHFFSSISEYIEKIEKFKLSISRKVTAKRLEDISEIVNNINSHHERERLYSSFDAIFLKIFPGFIEKFNELFRQEDKFCIGDKQPLSPELRIYALIRLGISDNEKIAKILGYSVNTIYTYKTRIKNKSTVPNEEFEKRLMEIKGV